MPDPTDRIIRDALFTGRVLLASRATPGDVIARPVPDHADDVVPGCTELLLPARPEGSPAPLLDTTSLHAEAAISLATRVGAR